MFGDFLNGALVVKGGNTKGRESSREKRKIQCKGKMSIKRRMKEKTRVLDKLLQSPVCQMTNKLFWEEKIINAQITN